MGAASPDSNIVHNAGKAHVYERCLSPTCTQCTGDDAFAPAGAMVCGDCTKDNASPDPSKSACKCDKGYHNFDHLAPCIQCPIPSRCPGGNNCTWPYGGRACAGCGQLAQAGRKRP